MSGSRNLRDTSARIVRVHKLQRARRTRSLRLILVSERLRHADEREPYSGFAFSASWNDLAASALLYFSNSSPLGIRAGRPAPRRRVPECDCASPAR